MVAVVLPACGLVSRLDGEGVVIGGKGRVNRCTPFPLDGDTRDAWAEFASPAHVVSAQLTGERYWDGETGEEDLIVSLDWNSGRPGIGHRIESGGTACSGRRESDLSIRSGASDRRSVLHIRDRRVGESDGCPGAGYTLRGEVGIEPDPVAQVEWSSIEVR